MSKNAAWSPVIIPYDGHFIHSRVRDAGTARTPIIFLHGITASVDLWPALLGDEFADVPCASVSLPGHGPSEVPDRFAEQPISADLFSDSLATAARSLYPDRKVHLAGWSTGGFAALLTAAKHPDVVASVTSICGFVRGRWGNLLGTMQQLARHSWSRWLFHWNVRQLSTNRWLLRSILQRFAAARFSDDDVTSRGIDSMQNGMKLHDPAVMAELFAAIRTFDESHLLQDIEVPACIIGGDQDPVIRPTETKHIADSISDCDLHLLPNTGHMFFAERNAQVFSLIRTTCERYDNERDAAG